MSDLLSRLLNRGKHGLKSFAYITEDLVVGPAPSGQQWHLLAAAGVRAVVEVREDARDESDLLRRLGMDYLHLAVAEGAAPALEELRSAAKWIRERISSSQTVLVHCDEGRGRSPLLACAFLVYTGFPIQAAYAMMRATRPLVELSSAQVRALDEFALWRSGAATED